MMARIARPRTSHVVAHDVEPIDTSQDGPDVNPFAMKAGRGNDCGQQVGLLALISLGGSVEFAAETRDEGDKTFS